MAAVLVAVVPVLALLAGCGGARSPANLADQQTAAELSSRIADARVELAMARRRLADVRRPRATVTGITRAGITTVAGQPDGPPRTVTALVDDASGPAAGVLVTFTVHGANAGASGTCLPVDCRSDGNGLVTFTYAVTHPGPDTVTIVCERTTTVVTTVTQPPAPPPTVQPPTTQPPGPPRIFQVELRNCRNLHVGYDGFPAGARVHWTVAQHRIVVAVGEFIAAGDDGGYHFLTQPLGVRLADVPDGAAQFTWVVGGVAFSRTAVRAAGC